MQQNLQQECFNDAPRTVSVYASLLLLAGQGTALAAPALSSNLTSLSRDRTIQVAQSLPASLSHIATRRVRSDLASRLNVSPESLQVIEVTQQISDISVAKLRASFLIYPLGSELVPDGREGEAGFQLNQQSSHYAPFHVAISVPSSLAGIKQIGDRAGWRVFPTNRDGLFDVIEFWVENRLMLELLTPTMVPKYLQTLDPETLPALIEQMFLVDA